MNEAVFVNIINVAGGYAALVSGKWPCKGRFRWLCRPTPGNGHANDDAELVSRSGHADGYAPLALEVTMRGAQVTASAPRCRSGLARLGCPERGSPDPGRLRGRFPSPLAVRIDEAEEMHCVAP